MSMHYICMYRPAIIKSITKNEPHAEVCPQIPWSPKASNNLDITAIFDSSSREGSYLLEFWTNWVHLWENEEKETIKKMLKFWGQHSFVDQDGRRIVEIRDNAVVILKGFDP